MAIVLINEIPTEVGSGADEIIRLREENAALRAQLEAAQERIKDLIAGDVMHEPNWSNCNEV